MWTWLSTATGTSGRGTPWSTTWGPSAATASTFCRANPNRYRACREGEYDNPEIDFLYLQQSQEVLGRQWVLLSIYLETDKMAFLNVKCHFMDIKSRVSFGYRGAAFFTLVCAGLNCHCPLVMSYFDILANRQAVEKRTMEPLLYSWCCLCQSVNQLYNNNKMAKLVLSSTPC